MYTVVFTTNQTNYASQGFSRESAEKFVHDLRNSKSAVVSPIMIVPDSFQVSDFTKIVSKPKGY